MKLTLKIIILFCLILSSLPAAIPAGYYDSATGLSGISLRQELHNIIDGHTQKTYDYLWTAFATTDIRTSLGSDYIWCMYTELEFHHDEDQSSGTEVYTTYNREHSWPKSWANETYPHYTDLFHLYPTQAYANSIRNDLPYGEVEEGTATYTSENGSQRGDARTGLGYSGTVFEPIDEYKGDLARTYFYISTRYYTEDSGWSTSPMTNKCELLEWAVNMLLDWHHNDPVSQKELDRVEAVYAIQGNRNPFIDHPDYADSIWASTSTSIDAPTAQSATSISHDRFTANWSSVSGADGYKLYVSQYSDFGSYISGYGPKDVGNVTSDTVIALSSSTTYYYRVRAYDSSTESANSNIINLTTSSTGTPTYGTIFFSEYIEGSSYNKALEIYNISGTAVDLSNVTIKLYSNTNTTATSTLTLSGTLSNKDVYVVAYSSSDALILAQADLTSNGVTNFNGNDAVELYYNDLLVDILGEVGSGVYFAQDVTLVRKADITEGNSVYTSSEWDSYSTDEFSYIGSHTVSEEALPITLMDFNAEYTGACVRITWTTASEVENAAFLLFRNDELIARIDGAGTSSGMLTYTFDDKQIKAGETYTYVISDVDLSGHTTSHRNKALTLTVPEGSVGRPASIGTVYPNPFNPRSNLPLTLNKGMWVHVSLYDLQGNKVANVLDQELSVGEYTIVLDLSQFPSAMYLLQVNADDDQQVQKLLLSK